MIAAPLYTPDQRDVLDRYYTPKRAIAPMLASWGAELQGARVLEPCAGRGDYDGDHATALASVYGEDW